MTGERPDLEEMIERGKRYQWYEYESMVEAAEYAQSLEARRCETCRHWDPKPDDGEAIDGICKRVTSGYGFAELIDPSRAVSAAYLLTERSHGCTEHTPRPETAASFAPEDMGPTYSYGIVRAGTTIVSITSTEENPDA